MNHSLCYVVVRREIDQSKMLSVVGEYLSDMNAGSKKPQNLVLFQFALEHVARISGVISQPGALSADCSHLHIVLSTLPAM